MSFRLFVKSYRQKGYWAVYERKRISDSRSVENISDKILRSEVQPAQTNESTTNVEVDRSF